MAYTKGGLRLISQSIEDVYPARWALSSNDTGGDSDATVLAAGYISDGQALGVKKGDIVEYLLLATPELYIHVVTVVAATGLTLGSSPATSS